MNSRLMFERFRKKGECSNIVSVCAVGMERSEREGFGNYLNWWVEDCEYKGRVVA